jgi:hypothetical protein
VRRIHEPARNVRQRGHVEHVPEVEECRRCSADDWRLEDFRHRGQITQDREILGPVRKVEVRED